MSEKTGVHEKSGTSSVSSLSRLGVIYSEMSKSETRSLGGDEVPSGCPVPVNEARPSLMLTTPLSGSVHVNSLMPRRMPVALGPIQLYAPHCEMPVPIRAMKLRGWSSAGKSSGGAQTGHV